MPSTYSTSLKLQLIGTGEQAGTWGTTTNYNLGTLLEQAITGVVTIPMGDATYTLSNYNGLSDEARNAVLVLQGPITAPQNLVIPPGQQKVYIVRNRTGNSVTLTTGTGSNISVANAASEVLFTDGANVYSATQFNYIDGDLTVSGTAYANNIVSTHNITLGNNLYANASTDQIYIPKGTTGQRDATGQNGLFRYNTTGQFYEGYANGVWIRFVVAPQGNYTIQYLMIAGGGGGGCPSGTAASGCGGGGAGGYLESTLTAIPLTTYTFTVGAGGSGSAATSGTNSSITGVTSVYGGGGGNGVGGGSGAGGVGSGQAGGAPTVVGQGNYGGAGSAFWGSGGGGGGAGGAGNPGSTSGGSGGSGQVSTITGTAVTRAGGGGGDGYYAGDPPYSSGGAGGSGGGGNGGNGAGSGSTAGAANSGSGGGANRNGSSNGGSGVIIIAMPTVNYTGNTTGLPLVTTYGDTTVLQYNNSGTYTA